MTVTGYELDYLIDEINTLYVHWNSSNDNDQFETLMGHFQKD